jgi:hypothetical protein
MCFMYQKECLVGLIFIMLCVLHFGITIRDGKVSTAVHLSLHYCGMYWF